MELGIGKREKARLKKFFKHDWCPLFGPIFDTNSPPGSIVRRCYQIIEEARIFLGSYWIRCTPAFPDATSCPSIQEIKDLLIKPHLIARGDPDSCADSDDLKTMSGIDEINIAAAREIRRQWVHMKPKAEKLLFEDWKSRLKSKSDYVQKPSRRLHCLFSDDQTLALLAISACHSILCDLDADQGILERDITTAERFLRAAINSHVRRSKKWMTSGKKGAPYGREGGKAKKGYEDMKAWERHEQWLEWAEEIQEKNPDLNDSEIARKIINRHPEVTHDLQIIRKTIKKIRH